jgi:tetratricopeptide (TPR) repeat protein
MEYDIFISYSRKDSDIVNQFVNSLTDAGYRVWIDREGIMSGDQFKAIIVRAIKNSSIVLFFSSANSNASKWTVKEISYALKKDKTIVPVKLDETEYDDSIDFDLINIDFIRYQHNNFSSVSERLIASIAKHLGKDPSTTSSLQTNNQSPDELYQLGLSYYEKEDYEQAVKYFKQAAELGHAGAQCNLGVCYSYGRGVAQDDKEAVKWYRKAAEQGHDAALYNMGICYEIGSGVTKDTKEAIKWYLKLAEIDDTLAIGKLKYLGYNKTD